MTFVWIDDQGIRRRTFVEICFERRIDDRTAADIADALRARGIQAAALAMDHLQVDMDVALRVLAWARTRRDAHLAGALADRRQSPADGATPLSGQDSDLASA